MTTDKELVEQMVEQAVKKHAPAPKVKQSMAWCIKFAIKDLEIDKKPITTANAMARAKELFKIHGE